MSKGLAIHLGSILRDLASRGFTFRKLYVSHGEVQVIAESQFGIAETMIYRIGGKA